MIQKNIKFICERELSVQFSSLVINVESIEKLYPDGFKGFFLSDIIMAYTNGYLVVVYEMMGYPAYLYSIIDDILEPLGFRQGKDYVIGLDEPTKSKGLDLPNRELNWCKEANWLRSLVAVGVGNKVWHTSFTKEQISFFNTIEDQEYPWTQFWTFWYNKHPVLKDLRLKKTTSDFRVMRIDESRYDLVDKAMLAINEVNRIPLLLGSQFGVSPRPEIAFAPDYNGHVAVLGKSMLSGVVAGLSIYEIKDQQLGEKILYIDNHKGIDPKVEELYNSMNN